MQLTLTRAARIFSFAAASRSIAVRSPRMQFISTVPAGLPGHLQTMAEELVAGEAVLLDIREPNEHAAGMLSCAEALPLSALQGGAKPEASEDTLLYLHCAAGVRVHPSAAILASLGFSRVVPLAEGYATLRALGFE